ncbi:tricarballylate utilization protein B [Novosphingobium endophyticum]|uniref:Tricarballylate utilization protein B n=1 Tax=Novosphingobium endophyticum TaxID=1955250 RepID=A0A916TV56_9SPHN|nr:tricarballylate utilization 4Fe-4S protein TcuB [Novosphingobium endophyticum]GGC13851.1 tricarballylate utilization protein B [Novosphingobium endophyticum]
MRLSDSLIEADRLMTICNSCRYCEGLCAVFPAMEMRRVFAEGDLNLLANLCHSCGACYDACQFAPPHEFAVNVPVAMARVRRESWEAYVWPARFAGLFRRNGVAVALIAALSVAAFIAAFVAAHDPAKLFAADDGPGAFYRMMPHNAMVALFGGVFVYAVFAAAMGIRTFWRDLNQTHPLPLGAGSLWQAVRDAGSLRYLDGGGEGCADDEVEQRDSRRLFHHLTFYGFLLCFASTSVATLYHYLLGREAPYPWYDLPVLLGVAGGIGLVIGPIGLIAARRRRRADLKDLSQQGIDDAFTLMLLLTALTGLALLLLRATPAMGLLLAAHLGVVFALFLTLPYGRFVHGLYRFAALVRHAQEMRAAGA